MPVVYSIFRSRCVVSPQRLFLMPVLPLNPPKSHSCPPRTEENALRAADEDVVDGDVHQLDDVSDNTHDNETDTDGLGDLCGIG